MKRKYLLGALIMAILGAFVALLVYTHLIDRPVRNLSGEAIGASEKTAPVVLTSMQVQQEPVDFTYAAEQTVHAVVHVMTKSQLVVRISRIP